MDIKVHQIGPRDLQRYFPATISDDLSDDFFISDIRHIDPLQLLREPCRFDGYLGLFCMEGRLGVEINLKTYEIGADSLVIIVPGTIGRVYGVDDTSLKGLHFVAVAMSREFLSGIRLDFVRLYEESLSLLDNPVLRLTESERALCRRYFDLAIALSQSETPGLQDALRQLVSSAFYYFGAIWQGRLSLARPQAASPAVRTPGSTRTSRAKMVFNSFLKLVSEHHGTERNMAFYADQLCLTPKYLSKLVKDVSGQSGPDWIDSFVILEAKNMLKYSDMPVKEIVYRLHFPNASVFYKFFRTHTGVSPSEYRK